VSARSSRCSASGAEEAALQQLNAMFDEAKKARQPYDAEAWLNLAFFLNEQYVEWPDDDEIKNGSLAIRRIPRKAGRGGRPAPGLQQDPELHLHGAQRDAPGQAERSTCSRPTTTSPRRWTPT
jgi:hypothetical protein